MHEQLITWSTLALELAGTGIILGWFAIASVIAAARLVRGEHGRLLYEWYRRAIGRGILLGLEVLVAADIIATIAVEPTFRSVGVLALVVLVRTFLSFSLQLEITGRWPWQPREGEPSAAAARPSPRP
jgi:uncharacterized membrane protein